LKGFQNEPIKMNRSSRRAVTIPHPAPSIALAGTPATFEGVISGTGDGLFSRFLFYKFEEEMTWSSQFGASGDALDQTLQAAAADFKAGYHELRRREEPLRITVPEPLQRVHDQTFASLAEKWSGRGAEGGAPASLRASLARSGLQAVKIASVLRGIRLVESGRSLTDADSIPLQPADMEAGLRLALTYLLHGVQVETRFREQTNPRAGLTDQKKRYLSNLPEGSFTTNEAKQLAERYDVTARNVQRWLKDWREAGLLLKLKRGTWAKLSPDLEGLSGAGSVISVINDIPTLTGGKASQPKRQPVGS
jgi:DNA-binding transcriptional ArsR family regulator